MEKRDQKIWRAPESVLSDLEPMYVTGRSWKSIYNRLHVQDKDFIGKKSVSIGNGLSDLPEHINNLKGGARCYGVDPIYAFLGKDYGEFYNNLWHRGISPHNILGTPEKYEKFKEGVKEGVYISATGEKLPFKDASLDLVVVSELIGNVGDQKVVLGIIDEAIRALKPDGEVRVPDLKLVSRADNLVSIDEEKNAKKPIEWLEILKHFQEVGCQVYSVKSPDGLENSGLNEVTVPGYEGIIVRKDNEIPRVTYISDDLNADTEVETSEVMIQLNAVNSKLPQEVEVIPINADVSFITDKSKT